MRIVIATIKIWNIIQAKKFINSHPEHDVMLITKKEDLTIESIKSFNPRYIFFPHWSWKIPKEIHENYECIVFHMTDLPYGRGGSPLQNLIIRKVYKTKISALRAVEEMDAGPIYMKENLCLYGNAEEIYIRASKIIFEKMIPRIISEDMKPVPQKGKVIIFKRRKKEDGNISNIKDMETLFDYIRMLDAQGYPKAFLETEHFIFEFSRASLKADRIIADVVIKPKVKEVKRNETDDNRGSSG